MSDDDDLDVPLRVLSIEVALRNLVAQCLRFEFKDAQIDRAIDEAIGALIDATPDVESTPEERLKWVEMGKRVVRDVLAQLDEREKAP